MKTISYLLYFLLWALSTNAQTWGVLTDNPSLSGSGFHPRNASSSTHCASLVTPANPTLFAHSWDGTAGYGQIGWGMSHYTHLEDFEYSGYINIPHATDIDVVIFESSNEYYILAAYYNDSLGGHYYDIYKYLGTFTVVPHTLGIALSSSSFGRINVDANKNGIAICWHIPGSGNFMRKATDGLALSAAPTTFIPGSMNYKDPDVAIGDVMGATNIYITSRRLDDKRIWCYRTPLMGGSFTPEDSVTASGANVFGVPRIDCPDSFNVRKWAVVYEMTSVSGGTRNETIKAMVFNFLLSGSAFNIDVHPMVTYSASGSLENLPVLSYSPLGLGIEVGWITKNSTGPIPGTTLFKYLAKTIDDSGGTAPAAIVGSYKMISNIDGGTSCPALAFSSVTSSVFTCPYTSTYHRLHVVYTHRIASTPPFYTLMYKNKEWPAIAFRPYLNEDNDKGISVSPNPFSRDLNISVSLDNQYLVTLTDVEGKVVFNKSLSLVQGPNVLNLDQISAGIYFLKIQSKEPREDYSSKIIKID